MSRYSRNFDNEDAGLTAVRYTPGYSRYRGKADAPDRMACQLCDGLGQYAGPAGSVDCDLCEGMGVLRHDVQHQVPLFRSRNKVQR